MEVATASHNTKLAGIAPYIAVRNAAACMTICGHARRLSRSRWKKGRGRAGISTSKIRTATFSASASRRPNRALRLAPSSFHHQNYVENSAL
jgi:hypothetical protein